MSGLADYLRQLDAGDWLTPVLESAAAEGIEPEGWRTPSTFVSPSDSHSVCEFDAQLALLGHRTGFSAKAKERVKNGTAAHIRITDNIERAGVLHAANTRLTVFADDWATDASLRDDNHAWVPAVADMIRQHGPIRWSGESDIIVRRSDTGTLHVGDIKTASRFAYAKIPPQESDMVAMMRRMINLPHYIGGYSRQLAQYVAWFRECATELGYTVAPECFLLFENTDTQEWTIRWMKADDALERESFRPGQMAVDATREGRLIEPPFAKRSATCNDCWRQSVCDLLRLKEGPQWEMAQTKLEQARELLSSQ